MIISTFKEERLQNQPSLRGTRFQPRNLYFFDCPIFVQQRLCKLSFPKLGECLHGPTERSSDSIFQPQLFQQPRSRSPAENYHLTIFSALPYKNQSTVSIIEYLNIFKLFNKIIYAFSCSSQPNLHLVMLSSTNGTQVIRYQTSIGD